MAGVLSKLNSLGGRLSSVPQYEIEDAAAQLLYEFDRSSASSRGPVNAEAFVKDYVGMKVSTEYLTDSPTSLCFTALEAQSACFTVSGITRRRELMRGEIVAERGIVERCDKATYFYALFHGFAHFALSPVTDGAADGQLSFGFSETPSVRHYLCDYDDVPIGGDGEDEKQREEARADNLALCLMLPKNPFKKAVNAYMNDAGLTRTGLKEGELKFLIENLSSAFDAPYKAVINRLKRLNYI